MLIFEQEADGSAVRTTTKAVVELLARADGEGGGLFVVEGAAPLEVAAGLPEIHVTTDEGIDRRANDVGIACGGGQVPALDQPDNKGSTVAVARTSGVDLGDGQG